MLQPQWVQQAGPKQLSFPQAWVIVKRCSHDGSNKYVQNNILWLVHGWWNFAAMTGELSKSKAKEYVLNMERHRNAAAAATSGATSIALAKESAQNIEVEEKWQGNAAAMLGCNKRTIRKESALNRGGKIPMRMKPWRSSKKVRKLSPYPHRGVFTFQVYPWLFPPLFYLKLCFWVSYPFACCEGSLVVLPLRVTLVPFHILYFCKKTFILPHL